MTIDANTVQVIGMLFTFLSLVFTGLIGVYQIMLKAKVDVAAAKVETVATTAGLAVNRVNAVAHQVAAGQQERTEILSGLVAEVAEVKKTGVETHVLVDGQMGRVLDIGLKAARLLAKAEPTEANLKDLELAEIAKREHEAKMKIVEAKNAVTS